MLLTSSETIDEAVGKIKPYVNTAIIKMGSKGSLLVRRGEEPAFLPSFLNTEVVDAIGAAIVSMPGVFRDLSKARLWKIVSDSGISQAPSTRLRQEERELLPIKRPSRR